LSPAARPLLWNLSRCCTRVRLAWADAGYSGKLAAWAASLRIRLEIVRKRDAHAFEVLPRRWVVERTLAWITAHRRCARDYERLPESHEAMVLWAMIAPDDPAPRQQAIMTRLTTQPLSLSFNLRVRVWPGGCVPL
jgi:transposase